jgi:hypothetical protein
MLLDLFGAIDVAEIDQHRRLHHGLEAGEVQRPELVPLGDDAESVGILAAS